MGGSDGQSPPEPLVLIPLRSPWAPHLSSSRGFTLLEMVLALFVVALLAALIVPRLGVLRGASLDASARQIASRVRFLREEAALRGDWIRLAVDPATGRYAAAVLVDTSSGARFLDKDEPLYRTTSLPDSIGIELVGPGVTRTVEGYSSAVFSPDGYADPAIIYLDDGAGAAFSIVIEPATTAPRVFDRRIDPRELLAP
jgi:prepilin-type N-terminal cleavage/methylation domain-containing protein